MLQFIPLALTATAAAVALMNLLTHWRARQDLSRAVARSSQASRTRLRHLLETGDVPGAVEAVSRHLDELAPRERAAAAEALSPSSPAGRRTYVQMVAGLEHDRLKLSRHLPSPPPGHP